jgi:hypothetical protein
MLARIVSIETILKRPERAHEPQLFCPALLATNIIWEKVSFRKGLHHHYRLLQKACDVSNWWYQRSTEVESTISRTLLKGRSEIMPIWRAQGTRDRQKEECSIYKDTIGFVTLLGLQNAMNDVCIQQRNGNTNEGDGSVDSASCNTLAASLEGIMKLEVDCQIIC